jgi:Sugar-transfer associated ATP-grasp
LKTIAALSLREVKNWRLVRLPLPKRVALWSRGFLSESGHLYDLADTSKAKFFLTDFERFSLTGQINKEYRWVATNKVLTWVCLQNCSRRIVPVFVAYDRGRVLFRGHESLPTCGKFGIIDALRSLPGPLVVKPLAGSGGVGVHFYEFRGGVDYLDGATPTDGRLLQQLNEKQQFIVCPRIEQAEYARNIFPGATNTIRLLTMYDDEQGAAFLACAVHRFGTKMSAPVDNWGKGGLSVAIDTASGVMSRGRRFAFQTSSPWHSAHPETGIAIEGVAVPGWAAIKDEVLQLASAIPFLPYVGWDVVLADDGIWILEANTRTDVNLLQVHGPLLTDPRVVDFYRRHGVLRGRRGRRGRLPTPEVCCPETPR